MGDWYHLHAHSEYSPLDGMSHIPDMVGLAVQHGHPALALTDHGLMSGAVELYKECRKAGIEPMVGMECYLVDRAERPQGKATEQRYHLTVIARGVPGYKRLVRLATASHERERYHRKPRLTLDDFRAIGAEHFTVLTGCFFGPLIQTLVTYDMKRANRLLSALAATFPHLYVELQNHDITHGGGVHDLDIIAALYDMAKAKGIRPVVTQDSHYCEPTHKATHDMMKRLTIFSEDPDDAKFPGDSFHLCDTQWAADHFARSHPATQAFRDGLDSMDEILAQPELRIPTLENYRYHVPKVSDDSFDVIETACWEAMADRKLDFAGEYGERLEYELDIIDSTGFAGYFDLVGDYVRWAREQGILVNARGSVNGCLIAYLLRITQVDPVEWGIMVERFMWKGRKTPPDIDLDIEQARRGEVLDYIASRYKHRQIGTFTTMGFTDDDGGKGSILINYIGAARRRMSEAEFAETFKGPEPITAQIRAYAPDDLDQLRALDKMKVRKNPGVHPAGVVLDGEGHHIADWIPSMLIPSSSTLVTQYQMDDVEALGFIKIDLLGLRSLTVLRRCQELIGRDDPLDLEWIPNDDPRTCRVLSTGVPENAIFQMEGYAMAKGVRMMRVRRTNDCVVAVALFRPALLETGQDRAYVARRGKKEKVTYPHPLFKRHLSETYGVPLYQEQVLEVLRDLGVPNDQLSALLKSVKASGAARVVAAKKQMNTAQVDFEDRCDARGFTVEQTEAGWEFVKAFAEYGFNKAHSVSYGLMAYRAGYLKAHYPLEYMTAVLESSAGTPKERIYLREARRIGIKILGADVNVSGASWSIDRKRQAIRRGLVSIKGIGNAAADPIEESAPYKDMDDLIARTSSKVTGKPAYKKGEWSGVLGLLRAAGALRSLGVEPD